MNKPARDVPTTVMNIFDPKSSNCRSWWNLWKKSEVRIQESEEEDRSDLVTRCA